MRALPQITSGIWDVGVDLIVVRAGLGVRAVDRLWCWRKLVYLALAAGGTSPGPSDPHVPDLETTK